MEEDVATLRRPQDDHLTAVVLVDDDLQMAVP
jgi:hypothetical protein